MIYFIGFLLLVVFPTLLGIGLGLYAYETLHPKNY